MISSGGQDSSVKLFNVSTGECLHSLGGLEGGTGSIAFSPLGFGGKLGSVAGGGWDGTLAIWDVEVGYSFVCASNWGRVVLRSVVP